MLHRTVDATPDASGATHATKRFGVRKIAHIRIDGVA
jgi:hypothetical protein